MGKARAINWGFWGLCLVGCCACSSRHRVWDTYTGESASSAAADGTDAGAPLQTPPYEGTSSTCAEGMAEGKPLNPRVILVLDGSCSMTFDYPRTSDDLMQGCGENPNGRWAALRRTLLDSDVGVVPKLEHAIQFGLVVYGTTPVCPIPGEPVAPALNNYWKINETAASIPPGTATPTGPALEWVYDNMIQPAGTDENPQVVVLATDGEPNSCAYDTPNPPTDYAPSVTAVTRGSSLGVTTYVVSLAAATGEFHDHLQQLANVGNPGANGAARLYEPNTPEALQSDLETLIHGVASCDIVLNGTVQVGEECSGRVTLNGSPIACNDPNGFILVDERHIRVQGTACEELLDHEADVRATFPCGVFTPD